MKTPAFRFPRIRLFPRTGLFSVVLAGVAAPLGFAQTTVATSAPVLSPTVGVATAVKLETESVEITGYAAYPPAITRPSGPFILHLVNRNREAPPNLQWAITSGPSAQLLALTSAVNLPAFAALPRQFSIVDLATGTYVLQTSAGKVFLTLTIK